MESPGPRPLRNINWPRGFPWLSDKHKLVVEEANLFVDRCIIACNVCHSSGGKFILEHPEDLGIVQRREAWLNMAVGKCFGFDSNVPGSVVRHSAVQVLGP